MFLITAERAEVYLAEQTGAGGATGSGVSPGTSSSSSSPTAPADLFTETPVATGVKAVAGFTWSGDVPHQKWMNFYTKVLSRFSNSGGLKIRVTVDVSPQGGVSTGSVDETRSALRELGATDEIQVKDQG